MQAVPGEGAFGIRRGYLWMLIGDQQTVKPDRMVLRWLARHHAPVLARHHAPVTAGEARPLLRDIAARLSAEGGRDITALEVDHAIWRAARSPTHMRSTLLA